MSNVRAFGFLPLLALGLAGPAQALNCAKAATPDEKAICGDAALKMRDEALSRFFFDTLRALKGTRHALLIADQRRWVEEDRDSSCDPGAKSQALVSCLSASLTARRRAIAICFANLRDGAPELAGRPIVGTDVCTFRFRPACPKVMVTASAHLADYPWLLDPLLKDADDASAGSGCDASGTTDQDESSTTTTLLAERPHLVSVRFEEDSMSTGAAHPLHGERILSYDTRSKAEIPITALLPGLKPGTPLLAKVSKLANTVLEPSCCDNDANHTFRGIGLDSDAPMPDGWAVSRAGDLILVYDYSALARDFVATATIPRDVVIDAVDPRYAGFFVKEPVTK